ncbi:DoxX family membrane protein [Nocardia crassostreae]|uniref:DoxX family membrane protein n=1 Tax=Nocardia crassostreae TaxID=53428 RepID=UPI000ABF7465|nr:DoxX family membrane protein [Nocardia crassostreae]
MTARTTALACIAITVAIELAWLLIGHGSLGWITATVVIAIALTALTAAKYTPPLRIPRVLIALLLLGSVADRFGAFGGPGAAGVSWGDYSAFVDYTRTLLPHFATPLAAVTATTATTLELGLGIALALGIRTRYTATATAILLAASTIAMLTSVGVDDMLTYAVPVIAAGAALIAVTADRPPYLRGNRPASRTLQTSSAPKVTD